MHSELHVFLWISGSIVTVGTAVGFGVGAMRWMNAVFEKGAQAVENLMSISETNRQIKQLADTASTTQLAVNILTTNHVAHVEAGMQEVAKTNQELVSLTKDIRDGIIKLVDRSERT